MSDSETSILAAVLRVVEDMQKRSVWLSDDTVPTVMSWRAAHRLHKTEPYIGCPFCHDKFMPVAEHEAEVKRLRMQMQDMREGLCDGLREHDA